MFPEVGRYKSVATDSATGNGAGGSPVPTGLSIRLFGGAEFSRDGVPLRRTRTRTESWLLAFLVLKAGNAVERSQLAGLFWPETREAQALANLRRSLSDLRDVLGDDARHLLSPNRHSVAFDPTETFCDVTEFDRARSRGDIASLRRAVGLYRGTLLTGCDLTWIVPERVRREQEYVTALGLLAGMARAVGEAATAADHLRQSLQIDPYREETWCALLEVLASLGDTAGVVLAYREMRHRFHDDLQMEPSVQTAALYSQITQPAEQSRLHRKSVSTVDSRANGATISESPEAWSPPSSEFAPLPRPVTSLIGRTAERADISAALRESRLVTLTGPGGAGKTRLALFVAQSLLESRGEDSIEFPDGVCFADLSADTDATNVVQTIAASLGVRPTAGSVPVLEAVAGFLQTRRMLLVVDNAEHLTEVCATLFDRLLKHCPELHLLCTSRQPLSLAGEAVFPVAPLAVPSAIEDGSSNISLESLAECDSVRLLLDRVRLAAPTFRMDATVAPAVASLCRALDGLPLALEIVAPRFRSLAPNEIVSRLTQQFHRLSGGGPGHSRHRTLQAALDWSYDLLSTTEQTLLRTLSVFRGGWTLEAAEAVHPSSVADAAAALAALVDKSLVVYKAPRSNNTVSTEGTEDTDSTGRYRFLETTGQYATERLNGSERDTARRRHAAFFLRLAKDADARAEPEYCPVETPALRRERDNFHAAISTLRDLGEQKDALALEFFGHALTGLLPENFLDWIDRLTREPPPPDALGFRMLYCTSLWALWSKHPATETLLESLFAAAESCGDTFYQVATLDLLGNLAEENGDAALSWSYMERAVALLPGGVNRNYVLAISSRAWMCLGRTGAVDEAVSRLERQIQEMRQHGDEMMLCDTLYKASELLFDVRDDARALSYCDEAIPLAEVWQREILPYLWQRKARAAQECREYDRAGVCLENALEAARKSGRLDRQGWIHWDRAGLAFAQGDAASAERHLCESLRLFQLNHEPGSVARCLVRLSEYHIAWGRYPRAAILLGSAERILNDYDFHDMARRRNRIDTLYTQIGDAIGKDITDRHTATGRRMTFAETVESVRSEGREK